MGRHTGTLWMVGLGALLLCAGLVQGGGLAFAAEEVLFGPAQYTRTSGPPNEFMETIPLPATLVTPFRIHVQNGNANGTNRISSAKIWVNGSEVAGPADFGQGVASFDRVVGLQASNTLQVRLTSTPGSFLILTLSGTVSPPTLALREPPTLPVTQGGTGTLAATISAPQAGPTTIDLQSSDSAIASVPNSVT